MRLRLIISFIIFVLISISIVVVLARQGAVNEVRAFMFRGAMTDTAELSKKLEDYFLSNQSWDGVGSLFPGQGRGRSMGQGSGLGGVMEVRIRVADAQGKIIFDTGKEETGQVLNNSELELAIPLKVDGELIGYLVSEGGMVYNSSQEQQLVERLNNAALTAALIAGAISLVVALFLAYQLLRPVNELIIAAQNLGEGDLTQRVPVRGNDELAQLGKSFNSMADSLEKSETSRQAMTADIAHELRNPLAVQRANLEALQDGIYHLTPENLQPLIDQNNLLTRLVDDLRTLATADSGQLILDLTQVNIYKLTEQIVVAFKPQADEQQIEISLGSTYPIQNECFEIYADPIRLEQILSNLVSNALRYTPDGGQISLSLMCGSENILVQLHDEGPGIPEESLPYIFDRFYRADQSRSRADGSTGLGLAIAQHLAFAHKGNIRAENHPNGGAVFTLTLPKS